MGNMALLPIHLASMVGRRGRERKREGEGEEMIVPFHLASMVGRSGREREREGEEREGERGR